MKKNITKTLCVGRSRQLVQNKNFHEEKNYWFKLSCKILFLLVCRGSIEMAAMGLGPPAEREELHMDFGGNTSTALRSTSYQWHMRLRDEALTCLIPGSVS